MTFDHREFIQYGKQNPPPQTKREHARTLKAVEQAAVKMHNLTGDANWDTFLSYLQATVEKCKAAKDSHLAILESPQLVNDEMVARRRMEIVRLNEKISTLNGVMALPIAMRAAGDKAKKQLAELVQALDEEPEDTTTG